MCVCRQFKKKTFVSEVLQGEDREANTTQNVKYYIGQAYFYFEENYQE